NIHIIGIGGAGMKSIASVLLSMGHQVSGSDLRASGLDGLRAEGASVVVGHDAANLGKVDLVTRSTAVPDSNPEVVAAGGRSIPVVSRAGILAALTRVRRTVSVAGTHGKTTTASMLSVLLREAGMDPSFIIGGEVNEIGSGAVWAESDGWFVVEADESDGTFLRLHSAAAIITSVEADHLSYYGSEAELVEAFERFVDGVAGPCVVCLDDSGAEALAQGPRVVTYGTDPRADWVISDYQGGRSSSSFGLSGPAGPKRIFELATPGLHNVRNATAAIVMGHSLGAGEDAAGAALARFGGVARRFQYRGERDGITYVDDYAHLPAEVVAALEPASNGEWERVVCVFQPHRYTRTSDLWRSFGPAFERADILVITGIYPAGEAPMPGVTGKLIVDAVLDHDAKTDVSYCPHRDELHAYLEARLQPGDLCLTLGAGDLTTLPDEFLMT
ncbi:MAG: UDP-N-acetylmuramate--L-alanine ligase, partial [Acidimicrobiales bacterium]